VTQPSNQHRRRYFNSSERVALYLAADGRCQCQGCGACGPGPCDRELEPGWHADHVQPHSRHGETDVINGQALCPPCNRKKGNTVQQSLRPWQSRALAKYEWASHKSDFLIEATPGAGKTILALTIAKRLLEAGEVQRVIVVCPTGHLRRQWADAAHKMGIELDPGFANRNGSLSPSYHGAAITYASLVPGAKIVRRLCSVPTLVILDEVHHCAEEEHSAWGRGLTDAFVGAAARRLMLSGTPFREDGRAIPFVTYENGIAVPDVPYSYAEALQDRICRPVEFLAYDGEMHWREVTGKRLAMLLSAATRDDDARIAFRSALLPEGEWLPDVLAAADRHLTQLRSMPAGEGGIPDAGGLVIAATRALADNYALLLEGITRQKPVVVVSRENGEDMEGEPDPSKQIAAFSANPAARWIIAVKMISEGVDIPRLAVGVYATNIWSEMFFRQAVGRFVRARNPDEPGAALFIPSVDRLLQLAARIADEVDVTLRAEAEGSGSGGGVQGELPLRQPLTSGNATEHSRIRNGEVLGPDELVQARSLRERRPEYRNLSDTVLAFLIRDLAPAACATSSNSPADVPTLSVEKQIHALRQEVNRAVNRYAYNTGEDFKKVHFTLNSMCGGDTVPTASIESLEKRLAVLADWARQR
jgi:superfamily II DNA or RNA helicase